MDFHHCNSFAQMQGGHLWLGRMRFERAATNADSAWMLRRMSYAFRSLVYWFEGIYRMSASSTVAVRGITASILVILNNSRTRGVASAQIRRTPLPRQWT